MANLKVYQIDAIVDSVAKENQKLLKPFEDRKEVLSNQYKHQSNELAKELQSIIEGAFLSLSSKYPLLSISSELRSYRDDLSISISASTQYEKLRDEIKTQTPKPKYSESEIRNKIILSDLSGKDVEKLVKSLVGVEKN